MIIKFYADILIVLQLMKTEFVITEDGSHTLFVPDLNEHYHSTHGAINESMHVFINAGLHKALEVKQKILLAKNYYAEISDKKLLPAL